MFNILVIVMSALQNRLARSERGEVSIEYVLVAGLAAIAIIAGMATFNTSVTGWFTSLQTAVSNALPG